MIPWWKIAAVLNVINLGLILALMYVYFTNYKKVRSTYILGLLLFASLFFIHNLVSFYYNFNLLPFYIDEVKVFAFVFTLLQTLALLSLTWVTWK